VFDFREQRGEVVMQESEVRRRAFAMPLTSPAYPVCGIHIVADLTLGLGKVVHDYLA
jgi:acetoacetate decarboxylase